MNIVSASANQVNANQLSFQGKLYMFPSKGSSGVTKEVKQRDLMSSLSATSLMLLSKGQEFKNPVLTGAINKLHNLVMSSSKLEISDIFDSFARNPLMPAHGSKTPDSMNLTKKIKIDNNTYASIGYDPDIISELSDTGNGINTPEAFIKLTDKKGNKLTNTEMYYAASYASAPKYGIFGKMVPLYSDYDKKLIEIAKKICN